MTSNHLLLFRIAELMLEYEQHILLVDLLFDDSQIGDFVKSIQIDSPYQQMLLEGVLTESVREEKLFVSFTVEGYFHYVLGEVIYKVTKEKDPIELKRIVEENKLNGAKEGVEQCLIRDVQKRDLKRLMWVIDNNTNSLELAIMPLANACLSFSIEEVLEELLIVPSNNDLILLNKLCTFFDDNLKYSINDEIKQLVNKSQTVENLFFEHLKSNNINEVKEQFKIKEKLNFEINNINLQYLIKHYQNLVIKLLNDSTNNYKHALDWISFLVILDAIEQAKEYYIQFIEVAEKKNDQESLTLALEQLGDCEYNRSCKEGYNAALLALTRAAEMRESGILLKKDKLKNTYRQLGFVYLSLGLQVIKSIEYFQKARSIILEESADKDELAEINYYIGLVYYWRGLRGTGRWGHKDEKLLFNIDNDPFLIAISFYQEALEIRFKSHGKIHPKSIELFHYLQETSYCVGNYKEAIPWLKLFVSIMPVKDKEHTDNFYLYSLIVSLEEYAKQISSTNKDKALDLINEALNYILKYDENQQIANRLLKLKHEIEIGEVEYIQYPHIKDLPELKIDSNYKGVWSKWRFSEQLKGFQTNNSMVDANGIWFFHLENKQLVYWDKLKNLLNSFSPTNWPEGCGRVVYDNNNQVFYAWSSIRSTVYELISPEENWTRMSYGVHDVHACGASFGYDQLNNRLYEFGGYGYFTYKNWLWVYDIADKKWTQFKDNKPGINPYPRNGQLIPIENSTKAILISGIGSDTGIQREHKPRMGLGSATDVGFFTWLRDAHELDLNTMEWKTILPANHESIRHEGALGYIDKLNIIVNWSGIVPSPIFGEASEIQKKLSCWQLNNNDGFMNILFEGDNVPQTDCVFVSVKDSNELLLIHTEGIWKLSVYDI